MENKKIIIGLVGQIAAGKGTIAKYLTEKHGAVTYRFSTIMRDILNRLHLEINRKNLQNLSTVLRKQFGEDLFAKVIANDVDKDKNKLIVVDGIRRLADIAYLKDISGFFLVLVVADPQTRYQRLIKRTENSGDSQKTFREFLADQEKEADIEIPQVMAMAKYELNNDGGFDLLYQQIDDLLKKIND